MITTTTADPDLTLLKNTFCIGFPCKLSDKKKGRGPCRPCGSWKYYLKFITAVPPWYSSSCYAQNSWFWAVVACSINRV